MLFHIWGRVSTILCWNANALIFILMPIGAQAQLTQNQAAPDARLQQAISHVLSQSSDHPYAAVLDYGANSSKRRFHIIERRTGQIHQSFVVAHGKGSDKDNLGMATTFSDVPGSLASSLGVFETGGTYRSRIPNHGQSLVLKGLSQSNANAQSRAVVIHANTYVEPRWLKRNGRPGRSHGCMVFSAKDRNEVVRLLKNGALVFAIS